MCQLYYLHRGVACLNLQLKLSAAVLQVAKSVEYVQQGTTALVDAKRLHKNTRKWLCIALIVVAIIVAIVIVVAIQPWKK